MLVYSLIMAIIDLLDLSRVESFQTTFELSKNTSDIHDRIYFI